MQELKGFSTLPPHQQQIYLHFVDSIHYNINFLPVKFTLNRPLNNELHNLPKHVGIIMDGNGRWAKQKKLPRILGHRNAIKAVRETVETCVEMGIETLTLYAFSTENWKRPEKEVNLLMRLFEEYLNKEFKTLTDNQVRLRLIGKREQLPSFVQLPLERALDGTRNNRGMNLCLAMDYGARDEITSACKIIAQQVKNGDLDITAIDETLVSNSLFTQGLSDPDLIIRTSGEIRLSNFLLWQAAYAEFYFTPVLWPDFNRIELIKAFDEYSRRVRRLGKVDV